MILRNVQTGETAKLGEIYADFRGDEWVLEGGRPPHKDSSSGHVWVRKPEGGSQREFYPFVIGMAWEEK